MTAGTGAARVLVVDDSAFMRTMIAETLKDDGIEVVGEVGNGKKAVSATAETDPDVVTMDHRMPEMSGLEAVDRIMDDHPTPIVMVSAYTNDGADVTLDALDRGAVDVLSKPGGEVTTGMARLKDELVRKVRAAARADVGVRPPVEPVAEAADTLPGRPTLVMASSTGGPKVVEGVLAALQADQLRVLVVQHMPEGFTDRFAERLDDRTGFDAREATDGTRIDAGDALVAPGDRHMTVTGYSRGRIRVSLSDDPPIHGIRPAADVTMSSAATIVDDRLVGLVLTGMGTDGADGIHAIKDSGGTVLAQDEETAVVFGMPGSAIETGRVDAVRPVGEIPPAVQRAARGELG